MIEDSKILIVGSGGIGCELLKNIVLSGFRNIDLVDLDTIELSNLNRQFLFRRHHIGQSKAEVAKEAVSSMAPGPNLNITAHFANITDTSKFPISFFESFDVVLNALDNLAARRYVNNMCLAVNVPLVESGTAGYLGQTSVIINRKTECFDCSPKEAPKTYPVCTIRSTPSAPIHCIVWAKEFLFPKLFGQLADDTDDETQNDPSANNSNSDSELLKETWLSEHEFFKNLRQNRTDPQTFFHCLFKKIFIEDIEKLSHILELWKDRTAPIPLQEQFELVTPFEEESFDDHVIWGVDAWISLLKSSIERLLLRLPNSEEISFDKDDQDTLDFVASISNLRALIFGIPLTSRFDLKAIAGNIIPAICTTNAIAAAMITTHAMNILSNRPENYCNAYINYGGINRRSLFTCEQVCDPNPDCPVCSVDRAILRYQAELNSQFPSFPDNEIDEEDITILEGNRLLYDSFDDNCNAQKTLSSLSISDSKFLKIDFDSTKRRPLLIGIVQDDRQEEPSDYIVSFDLIQPKVVIVRDQEAEESKGKEEEEEDIIDDYDDEEDFFIMTPPTSKKAKLS